MNDISYYQDATSITNGLHVNEVYFLSEENIKSLYAKLKNLKSEIESMRLKKLQEFNKKDTDQLKSNI